MINLRDESSIVSYLQIFLKTYFPEPCYVDKFGKSVKYNDKILKVTGKFDTQTYLCLSSYISTYYPDEKFPFTYEIKDDGSKVKIEYDKSLNNLKSILDNNMSIYLSVPEVMTIPDRIMSYVFGVVVDDNSEDDLIYEIQKIIYDNHVPSRKGDYSTVKAYITKVQTDFVEMYTKSNRPLPDQFADFKVTGYTDPWTEVLLKGSKDEWLRL